MIIGAMNHPMRDVGSEIRRFHDLGFDFVDLTLEPERARPRDIDVAAVRQEVAALCARFVPYPGMTS